MEVWDGQELSLSLLKPTFLGKRLTLWAMPVATRVIGDSQGTTPVTLIHMSSQLSRPTYLDGMHHPKMPDGHAVVASRSVLIAKGSEDMSYFERWSHGKQVFP